MTVHIKGRKLGGRLRMIRILGRTLGRTTSLGYLLSTLGLTSAGFGLARLVASWGGQPASSTTLALALTIGALLAAIGFALLVAGADPIDDADWSTLNGRSSPPELTANAAGSRRTDECDPRR